MESVRLSLSLSLSLLVDLLGRNESVVLNRVEFSSLLQYLVSAADWCHVAPPCFGPASEGTFGV